MTGCDTIILNQENFLLRNNGYLARNALPEHHLLLKPAIKDGLEGRPKSGMFIAVPLLLKESVKDVPVDSNRLQCAIVTLSGVRILIVNSYFPTAPRTNFDEHELLVLFAEIKMVIDENSFDHIVLGGDFNADFSRRTKFVTIVSEFMDQLDVNGSWSTFQADFSHVTEKDEKTYTSLIDHFFWDNSFSDRVVDAGVLHVPENMSDHSPIYCKLNMEIAVSMERSRDQKAKKYIPSWQKADDTQKESYRLDLKDKLDRLHLPTHCLNCRDVHCNEPDHMEQLDEMMMHVLKAIEELAMTKLSYNQGRARKKRNLPNWKEDVDPVKDTAHFWHAVWKSAGKPINCQLCFASCQMACGAWPPSAALAKTSLAGLFLDANRGALSSERAVLYIW